MIHVKRDNIKVEFGLITRSTFFLYPGEAVLITMEQFIIGSDVRRQLLIDKVVHGNARDGSKTLIAGFEVEVPLDIAVGGEWIQCKMASLNFGGAKVISAGVDRET